MKDYVKGIRRQATDREKIFGKYMFNERLLSKIYKECLKLNNTQNPLQYCKVISLQLIKINKKNPSIIRKQATWLQNRPKTWTDTSPQKIYTGQISICKDIQHHMSSGNCRFKQQDINVYLLQWPKFRRRATPNSGKDLKQPELPFISGAIQNCTTLEDSLAIFYKIYHTLTIWFNPLITLIDIYSNELMLCLQEKKKTLHIDG